jgi:hypothetical protein
MSTILKNSIHPALFSKVARFVSFWSVATHTPITGYWNFHNEFRSFLWGRNTTDSTLVFFYYNLMANG